MPHGALPHNPLIAPEVDRVALFHAVQQEFAGTFEALELVAASTARCLFRARDVVLKRHVGLRIHVQLESPSRQWFERENEILATLDHPAVRAVLTAGYRNEWAYRIVKWIEGESLADAVARGPLAIPTVLRLARNLASVLDYVHTLGIVMRRLAPPTIMIDNSARAHVIDLRYANVLLEVASPETDPEQEPFIAPEIRGGDPGDPSCDVYSAAALLYFAVTGAAPDIEPERLTSPRSIREACPMALERVIMRGLRRDPTDRFLTAIEMVEDLLTDLGDFDVQSPLASERAAPQADDPRAWEKRLRRALGDEYELLEELGAGGFGRVYRVRDLELERQVALKVLHPHLVTDPEVVERFRREARMAAQLVHPYIANTYDIGQRGGLLWYTMEYVRGRNLARTVQAEGPLPAERVVRVLRETLSALEYAHAFGLVHRDLKPENILIDKATGNVRIVDFGLAIGMRGKDRWGRTASQSGTPDFAAPEQLLGEHVDHRSDLYSLSLVGLYALTGRLPFGSGTVEATLALRATGNPPELDDLRKRLPVPLARVLARGVAAQPAERFQSAAEYGRALRAATRKSERVLSGLWRKITKGN
jgi:serine/threonine-protein kinase